MTTVIPTFVLVIVRSAKDVPACVRSLHDSIGLCDNGELYSNAEFETPLRFLSHTVIPPAAP